MAQQLTIMNVEKLNFFIVDKSKSVINGVKKDLERRFGSVINMSVFYDEKSCLEKINDEVDGVILIYLPNQLANGQVEMLKAVRAINPNTKIMVHSPDTDISKVFESFSPNTDPDTVKNTRTGARLLLLINKYVTDPLVKFAREFGISRFMMIFTITFGVIALLVFLFLVIIYK